MVQLAKTRGIDAAVLYQCAPSLNSAQIRRLLANYVPDDYEDGPVPVALIRKLDESPSPTTTSINPNNTAITLKTIEGSRLTIHQDSLLEIEAEKLDLTMEVPSTLWKIFLLSSSDVIE